MVRYWVDKASAARTWTTPAGVTRRTTSNGSGGGSLSAITADAVDVPAGTAAAAQTPPRRWRPNKAIAWTIVVPHA